LGAYGLVGVCATPVVLYEAWSAGRLPIGVSRTVRVHINGPVGPHVGVVDLVLGLVSDVGFDGYAGAVLEFQGDAVEGLTAHRRAALLAAASMTNCLTALTPLNEASLEHAKRLGMTSSLSLSEFARYRPDEEAAYRELAIVNADQTRPAAAWPRQGLVRPVAEVAGRQVDRIVVGGCVGGDHESLVELAIMVESDPVAKGIDFFAVAGSDRIRQQAAHSGTEARLASAGVRLVTPGQVPAGGQGRTVLTDNPCLDPSAIVVSLPTAVASAARKRLTSLGVGA
jgi:homoaconitase/3-isopropylmalate dehydratase large subunit